jgi:hypothetical protein
MIEVAKTPKSMAKKPASGADSMVEPAAQAAPRRRVTPWLIAAAGGLAVGLLIWAGMAGLIPGGQAEDRTAAAMESRFSALEQRLAAIEDRLARAVDSRRAAAAGADSLDRRLADIEARPPAAAPPPVDLGPLEDRLSVMESDQKDAWNKDLARAAGASGALGDLADRIAALEARPTVIDTEPPPAATLLAVAQLHGALRCSAPFAASLAALEALAGPDDQADDDGMAAALAALTPHAATGIATLETLRDRFTPLAEAILRAAVVPPGESWASRTLARLSGLVTLRRVGGDVAGDTTEAIVARAEARLALGDLAAAVAEVAALDGARAEAAAFWLGDARARLAAEAALAALDARAIAAMGGN